MNTNNLLLNPDPFLQRQRVFLVTLDKLEEFSYRINEGASDMARLTGITYIWDAPVERVVEQQISVINNAVANGADLIMIQALDPIRVSGAVEAAKARGVRIIYVDSPAVESAIVTLATDNYNAGQTAGQLMINELELAGIITGDIGIVEGIPEMVTRLNRQLGFRDVIKRDGRYQLLDTRYAQGNPVALQNEIVAVINENPSLVGLFTTYEVSTTALGYALMGITKPIIGIGFDLTDIIRDMLNNEVLRATLVQNPYTMGYLGMAQAIAALTGKDTGPNFINTGVSIVTRYMRRIVI